MVPSTAILDSRRAADIEVRLIVMSVFAVVAAVAAGSVVIYFFCGGHLIYSLDDPYISLALGWHIGHGHYGLNDGEPASPSSSILYPLLLAGFAWTSLQEWIPLLVNTLAAAATAAIFVAILCRYAIITPRDQLLPSTFLILSLCVAINGIGLVFTGLEHSAHAMTSVAVVFGLACVIEGENLPIWLIPAIVLLPLWRFEGLALAGSAIFALTCVGHWKSGVTAASLILLTLGAYMIVMTNLGLPLVPSSVMVKSSFLALSADGSLDALSFLQRAAQDVYVYKPAWAILVLVLLLAGHPFLRQRGIISSLGRHPLSLPREWLLVFSISSALLAHVLFGGWGWMYRYEAYAAAFGLAGVLIVWHGEVARLFAGRRTWTKGVLTAMVLLAFDCHYLWGTIKTPFVARGIYEEQYQMHRFAVDFYKGPVAVNDLGWVSYGNPNYVLDLWGLGSEPARKARLVTREPGWVDRLVRAHGVGVAMIYPEWFGDEVPREWRRLATEVPADRTIFGHPLGIEQVTYYSTSTAATPEVIAALKRFAQAADQGAELHLYFDASPVGEALGEDKK
jgi:hypothetical protein